MPSRISATTFLGLLANLFIATTNMMQYFRLYQTGMKREQIFENTYD